MNELNCLLKLDTPLDVLKRTRRLNDENVEVFLPAKTEDADTDDESRYGESNESDYADRQHYSSENNKIHCE